MAASTVPESEIEGALELLCDSVVDAIYLVDSFGSFYSEQVHYLVDKYLGFARPRGKTIGMHAHNNQQLAYANTIEAAIKGANLLDSSMAGLGRGAGNCQTELLIGFLHNPRYHLRPVLQCIQEHIEPLRKDLRWGFDIPYMITGLMNQHPRAAMAFNGGERSRRPGQVLRLDARGRVAAAAPPVPRCPLCVQRSPRRPGWGKTLNAFTMGRGDRLRIPSWRRGESPSPLAVPRS